MCCQRMMNISNRIIIYKHDKTDLHALALDHEIFIIKLTTKMWAVLFLHKIINRDSRYTGRHFEKTIKHDTL